MTNDTTERVLIGSKDVMRMLNIGRTTLHRVRTKDSTFPKPIKDCLLYTSDAADE